MTRYEHSLQSATRAHRDGKSEEYVAAALLHDIGDELAPHTHSEMVGAILRPYVSEEICWIVASHGAFQMYYYAEHYDADPNARERLVTARTSTGAPSSASATTRYCFDPAYESLPVEFFEPMVRRVFAEPRYLRRGRGGRQRPVPVDDPGDRIGVQTSFAALLGLPVLAPELQSHFHLSRLGERQPRRAGHRGGSWPTGSASGP